jgi:hypothetical protein
MVSRRRVGRWFSSDLLRLVPPISEVVEAASISETSVNFYRTARRKISGRHLSSSPTLVLSSKWETRFAPIQKQRVKLLPLYTKVIPVTNLESLRNVFLCVLFVSASSVDTSWPRFILRACYLGTASVTSSRWRRLKAFNLLENEKAGSKRQMTHAQSKGRISSTKMK